MKTALTIAAAVMLGAPATAAAQNCRIEKPARATYRETSATATISELTETGVPSRRTTGGSACATASWLAYEYERDVAGEEEPTPETLKLDGWREGPPTTWRVREGARREVDGGSAQEWRATFVHGHERVAVRIVLKMEGEGPR